MQSARTVPTDPAMTDGPRAAAWAAPLLAVQFLTRVPVPLLARLSAEQARDGMVRATGWFPLVGTLIGVVTAAVFFCASSFWPPLIAALLALGVEALLTGAIHEDAVADFCDAFGGNASGDDARRILKDSRIGSYGALGLVLSVGVRVTAIATLAPEVAAAAIIGAATMARLWAVALLALAAPVTSVGGVASGIGRPPVRTLILAGALSLPGLLPIALLVPIAILATAAASLAFLPWLARFLRQRIGGSTGDCLGFAAYMGQLALLLAAAAR